MDLVRFRRMSAGGKTSGRGRTTEVGRSIERRINERELGKNQRLVGSKQERITSAGFVESHERYFILDHRVVINLELGNSDFP